MSYTSSPPSAFMACGGTALTGYTLRNIRSYVGKYVFCVTQYKRFSASTRKLM
jgi:hypothetical protein